MYREGKERPSHHSYRSGQDYIRTINLLEYLYILNYINIKNNIQIHFDYESIYDDECFIYIYI